MARKEFVTPKGTTLPLLNLKGKEYLQVADRLIWFREEHPDWQIVTAIMSVDDKRCIVQAMICNEKGERRASAHKCEDQKHFPDYIEKAETGAIGRALALCGYGTQFCADDLDEKERLADAPRAVTPLRPPSAKPIPAPPKDAGPNFDDFPAGPLNS